MVMTPERPKMAPQTNLLDDFADWGQKTVEKVLPEKKEEVKPKKMTPGEKPEGLAEGAAYSVARGAANVVSGVPWVAGQALRLIPGELGEETAQGLLETSDEIQTAAETRFPKSDVGSEQLFTPDEQEANVRQLADMDMPWFDFNPKTVNAQWAAENVPEMAISVAASMLGGAVAKVGNAALQSAKWAKTAFPWLSKIGDKAASFTGAGIVGGALEGAGKYKQLRDEGYTHDEAADASGMFGLAVGALSGISGMKILNPEQKSILGKALVGGLVEGGTEFLESPAGALIEKARLGKEIDVNDMMAAGMSEGVMAGFMGGAMAPFAGGEKDASQDRKAAPLYGNVRDQQETTQNVPAQRRGQKVYEANPEEVDYRKLPELRVEDLEPGLTAIERVPEQPFRFMGNKSWVERDPVVRENVKAAAEGKTRIIDAFGGSGTYSGVVQRLTGIPERVVNEGANEWLQNFHKDMAENREGLVEQAKGLQEEFKDLADDEIVTRLVEEVEKGNSGAYLLAQNATERSAPLQKEKKIEGQKKGLLRELKRGNTRETLLAPETVERVREIPAYNATVGDGWSLAKQAGAEDVVLLDPGKSEEQDLKFVEKQIQELKPAIDRGASFIFHNSPNEELQEVLEREGWTVHPAQRRRGKNREEIVAYSPNVTVPQAPTETETPVDPVRQGIQRSLAANNLRSSQMSPKPATKQSLQDFYVDAQGELAETETDFSFEEQQQFLAQRVTDRVLESGMAFDEAVLEQKVRELVEPGLTALFPGVYSPTIRAAKLMDFTKGTPDQALAAMRRVETVRNLRQEEMDFIGLTDWLKLRTKVTKQEIVNFVDENAIGLETWTLSDKIKKDEMSYSKYVDAARKALIEQELSEFTVVDANDRFLLKDKAGRFVQGGGTTIVGVSAEDAMEMYDYWRSDALEYIGLDQIEDMMSDETKEKFYATWRTGNKRVGPLKYTFDGLWLEQDKAKDRREHLIRLVPRTSVISNQLAQAKTPEDIDRLERELTAAAEEFSTGHFSSVVTNVMMHIRSTTIEDMLFLEEVQDDWAQDARDLWLEIIKKKAEVEGITEEEAARKFPLSEVFKAQEYGMKADAQVQEMLSIKDRIGKLIDARTYRRYGPAAEVFYKDSEYAPTAIVDQNNELVSVAWTAKEAQEAYGEGIVKRQLTANDLGLAEEQFTEFMALMKQLHEVQRNAQQFRDLQDNTALNRPWQKSNSWGLLAVKRMIALAAEEGQREIGWTSGDIQNKRNSLSHVVSQIHVTPNEVNPERPWIIVYDTSGNPIDLSKAGFRAAEQGPRTGFASAEKKQVAKVLGKEWANKIFQDNGGTYNVSDFLEIGGEPMRAFYDRILVNSVNKFLKPYGISVTKKQMIPGLTSEIDLANTLLAEDIKKESDRLEAWKNLSIQEQEDAKGLYLDQHPDIEPVDIWTFPITEELRKAALGGDLPLFTMIGMYGRGANVSSLMQAAEALDRGADPRDVWRETGWFKGPDDKWRFEIDDSKAKLKVKGKAWREMYEKVERQLRGDIPRVKDFLDHPRLFYMYPYLADIPVFLEEGENASYTQLANGSGKKLQMGIAMKKANVMPLLMHELQHSIQFFEDMAIGTSIDTERQKILAKEGNVATYNKAVTMLEAKKESQARLDQARAFVDRVDGEAVRNYLRNFGEVEARITQKSVYMDEAERAASFPFDREKIPPVDYSVTLKDGTVLAQAHVSEGHSAPFGWEFVEARPTRTVAQARRQLKQFFGETNLHQMEKLDLLEVLNPEEFEKATGQNSSRVFGFAHGGKIYLNSDAPQLIATFAHEGSHSGKSGQTGFRALLGGSYDSIQRQFDQLLAGKDKIALEAQEMAEMAAQYAQTERGITDTETLNWIRREERLAYYTQLGVASRPTPFMRIWNAIKAMFRASALGQRLAKMGIAFELTPEMAVEMSRLAMQKAMRNAEGELVTAGLIVNPELEHRSFHGTRAVWEKGRPNLRYVGSGESNAAYGWGFYSAEEHKVGETYRRQQSNSMFNRQFMLDGKTVPDLIYDEAAQIRWEVANQLEAGEGQMLASAMWYLQDQTRGWGVNAHEHAKAALASDVRSENSTWSPEEAAKVSAYIDRLAMNQGNLYELEFRDDDVERYLDWDKKILAQNPETVKKLTPLITRIVNSPRSQVNSTAEVLNMTGGKFYTELGKTLDVMFEAVKGDTSRLLREAGIPGTIYLDQFSRPPMRYAVRDGKSKRLFESRSEAEAYAKEHKRKNPTRNVRVQTLDKPTWIPSNTRNLVTWDQAVLDRAKVISVNGQEPGLRGESFDMKGSANIKALAQMLGPQLYGNPTNMAEIAIKELFQNSADAVIPLIRNGKRDAANIDILTDADDRTIQITDDGVGMTRDVLANAFFRIAGSDKQNALNEHSSGGGFGFAKLVFLYGAEKIQVMTKNTDGEILYLSTSGPDVMDTILDEGKTFKVVKLSEEEARIAARMDQLGDATFLDNPTGTLIRITIPRTFKDPTTGREADIYFPHLWQSQDVLNFSPLFYPVNVTYNGNVQDAGAAFPIDSFAPFATIEADWGTARIIVSRNEVPPEYDNLRVLSNGIYQFALDLKENPLEYSSDLVPRTIYLNLEPKVSPQEAGYPIAHNRKDFSAAAKDELMNVLSYLSVLYAGSESEKSAQSFGRVQYLTGGSSISEVQNLTPEAKTENVAKSRLDVDKISKIKVENGKLFLDGKELPALTSEEIKNIRVDVSDFRIPQESVDAKTPMLHDNVEIDYSPEKLERTRLQKEYEEATDLLLDTPTDAENSREVVDQYMKAKEAFENLPPESEESKYVPLTEVLRERHGEKFNTFMRQVGDVFKEVRGIIQEIGGSDYADLENVPVGVSFDKTYYGVHAFVPFQGMFINPALVKYDSPTLAAHGMLATMLHEIAHHVARDHEDYVKFNDTLARINILLDASTEYDKQKIAQKIARSLVNYSDIFNDMRSLINDGNARNIGKSLVEYERRGSASDAGDVGGFGNSGRDSWAMDQAAARRAEDEGVRTDVPRDTGEPEVGLTSIDPGDIQRANEDFLRFYEHDPGVQRPSARERAKGLYDTVIYYLQDKLHYLDKKQKSLGELDDDVNPYRMETVYHGRVSTALEEFTEGTQRELAELGNATGRSVDGPGGLDIFLLARHAQERNRRIRQINAKRYLNYLAENSGPQVEQIIKQEMQRISTARREGKIGPDTSGYYLAFLNRLLPSLSSEERKIWDDFAEAPSGMTDARAAAILEYEKNNTALFAFADRFDRMNREGLDLQLRTGLITQEEYDSRMVYKHWAPLREENFEDLDPKRRRGSDLLGLQGPPKQLLAHAVATSRAAIIRAERHRVLRTLYNLVKSYPESDFWRVGEIAMVPKLLEDGSVRLFPSRDLAKNELSVKIDGKTHVIWFNPSNIQSYRIALGFKNLDNMAGPFINAMNYVNRYLSFMNTSASPEFILSNFPRDFLTAQYNMSDTEADNIRWRAVKDTPSALKGIRDALRTDKQTEWTSWYKDFAKHGGVTGWVQSHERAIKIQGKIEKQMKELRSGPVSRAGLGRLGKIITDYNMVVENGIRLSVYKNLVTNGVSRDRAAEIAKELTVNFNRKGEAGPTINAFYLFANAGIQGSARILIGMRRSKKIRRMMVATVGMAFALAISNALQGGDDDDGIPRYLKIQPWIRERNMVFMREDGTYAKFPLPWGFNVLWVLGDQMAEGYLASIGKNPEFGVMKSLSTVSLATLGAFSPIQGGTAIQAFAPTVLDPIAQIGENKTFTGAPLKPENNPWQKVPAPEHQLYWNSARAGSVRVAEIFSDLTGGDEIEGGAIDFSPEYLDLAFDTIAGSAGRFVIDTLNLAVSPLTGEKSDLRQTPLLRRVAGEITDTMNQQLYLERVQKIWIADKKYRERVGEPNWTLLRLRGKAKATEKIIRRLRELKRRTVSEERKEELQERIEREMAEFNVLYRERLRGG